MAAHGPLRLSTGGPIGTYREVTGKPLGIIGEVAEYDAARLLKLDLTPAPHAGHDAVRKRDGRKFQIKGRCSLAVLPAFL